LQGKPVEAVSFLRQALEKDTDPYCKLAAKDKDFDGIRDREEFKKLLDEFCQEK